MTGVAAGVVGPAFVLGPPGGVAACNALRLAARYPPSSGTYGYGYRVRHPALGFAAGLGGPLGAGFVYRALFRRARP